MGQCGITSSKTVLVFLNLIFWVRKRRIVTNNVQRPREARGWRALASQQTAPEMRCGLRVSATHELGFFFFSLIIHGRRVTSGFTVKEDVQFGEAITRGELAGVSVAAAHKLQLSMTLCSSCQVLKLLLLLLSEPAVLLELDCVVIQQTSRVGLT